MKALLILAVLLVVFVVACGKVEVRVWTTGDSHAAIDNFGNISSDVYAGLVKIGLTECAQFHP